MRSEVRWRYLVRSPKILWDIVVRGRYRFTFDLMPMRTPKMSLAKRWNLLKAGLNLIYRRPKPWSWPIHLQIEISSRCGLKCPVCPRGTGILKRDQDLMDLELFKKLMAEAGPYLLTVGLYSWGEPLLHPQFAQMVKIAKSYGVITVLSTNGQNLNDQHVLSGLISEPLTYLIVAIDGLTDQTNSVYRVGAKLAPILDGVKQLAQMKLQRKQEFPRLHMRYIVMKHNQHQLPQLQSFAAENSFDLLTVRGLSIIGGQDSPHKDLLPDLEQYRAYRYRKGQRIKRLDFVCMQAFCYPAVFSDGKVVPCDQDFSATQAYGRIGNGVSFSDLWFAKRTAATRKVIRDNRETFAFCVNCPFADHSSNTCSLSLLWPNSGKPEPKSVSDALP